MSDLLHIERIYLSIFDQLTDGKTDHGVSDVVVTMLNQTNYIGVFYTFSHLQKSLDSEQCRRRLYWCMPSCVLVHKIDPKGIRDIVDKMIDQGDFQLYFTKMS